MMLGVASPNGAEEPSPYFSSRGMKWIQQYSVPGMSDKELKIIRQHPFI